MQLLELDIVKVYLLVLVRVSGLILTAPILGSSNFPMRAKAALSALIAMLITPIVPGLGETLPSEPLAFALLVPGELFIGVLMGFVMTIMFAAIQVGGQIIDMQTGFGMMNVFNPAMESQVPIFGFYLFIIATLYLLACDGHLLMLRFLAHTFDVIPLGKVTIHPELMLQGRVWGRAMFIDGMMIAAPVAAAMLLTYMTLGLMGRLVPQIHMFVIGFPITIMLGLFLVAFTSAIFLGYLNGMFNRTFDHLSVIIRGLTPPAIT